MTTASPWAWAAERLELAHNYWVATTGPAALDALLASYRGKYGSGFPDPVEHPVFAVRPRVAFAVVEREPMFSRSATRWVFGPSA
jgi:hypothetical protein